jgi:hypothetical protein
MIRNFCITVCLLVSCNKAITMDASQKETTEPAHFLLADLHANVAPAQQPSQEALPSGIIVPSFGKTRWQEANFVNIFGPKPFYYQQITSLIKCHQRFIASRNPNLNTVGAVTEQTAIQQPQQTESYSLGEKPDTNP